MLTWALIVTTVVALLAMEIVLRVQRKQAARQQDFLWDATQHAIRERLNDPERLANIEQVRGRIAGQQQYLDKICRTAAVTLKAPKSVMTMLDGEHQSWIAHHFEDPEAGGDLTEPPNVKPLTESYCRFSVASDRTLVIDNAPRDVLVRDNPCTTVLGMRAYLGSPVHSKEGFPIGSLCVFDFKPRKWSKRDIAVIESLAALVNL